MAQLTKNLNHFHILLLIHGRSIYVRDRCFINLMRMHFSYNALENHFIGYFDYLSF